MELNAALIGIEGSNSMAAIVDTNNDINNELTKFDQHFEASCTAIEQITNVFNINFGQLSKEFKLPQHSGDTPARVQQQYPRILASAPPKTWIRYRSKVNTIKYCFLMLNY